MASTFVGIEMGKKSLITEQTAMKTTGHNISNANTEGFSRQRITRKTEIPLEDPSLNRDQRPGQIGQGVEISKVERIRDFYIDDRINDETTNKGYWKTKNDYLYRVEMVHNEPDDKNIRSLMDQFWNSMEEVANNPSEPAVREVARERARTLTSQINHTYDQLATMQKEVNHTIRTRVDEINDMTESIRQLNVMIKRSENVGDNPNDLYDRRDLLVEKLTSIANVTVGRGNMNEFIVYLGNSHIVQGEQRENLIAQEDPANRGFYKLLWENKVDPVRIDGGEMKGLLELRDKDLDYQIRQLNSLSANLTDTVNEIHRDGFDLNNNTNLDFFKTLPITKNANGDYDTNGDGTNDMTALFKVAGKNVLKADSEIGVAGTISLASNTQGKAPIQINYVATDKVSDVIKKINNSQAEVVAYLNHNSQLGLKATTTLEKANPDFVIRHLEDSGDFLVNYSGLLAGNGAAGAYDYQTPGQIAKLQTSPQNITLTPMFDPSGWLSISESINLDVRSIAAARGTDKTGTGDYNLSNGPGDGGNALLLAQLRYKKVMIGDNATMGDFYTSVISRTGTQTEQADIQLKTADKLLQNLTTLRTSISGVNLDEEMANLIVFQHAYNAAAHFISVQDKMLETIIHMGV